MKEKQYGPLYLAIRQLVRFSTPLYSFQSVSEHAPRAGVVYVSRHRNLWGPVTILARYPVFLRTWALSVFFDRRTCYKHYVDYTFTQRFGLPSLAARFFACPISFFVAELMKSGNMIPVHRGSKKIIRTLRESARCLEEGDDILVFPDVDYASSRQEINDLYSGFLAVEKYYNRKTGQHVSFVPLYADEKSRILKVGQAIRFCDQQSFSEQKEAVAERLRFALNELANSPDSEKDNQRPEPKNRYKQKKAFEQPRKMD